MIERLSLLFSAFDFPECGVNARAVDMEGVLVCECLEGYEVNGTICTGLLIKIS